VTRWTMGGAGSVPSGRIFISYRREETAYPAGWLFDRLTEHFGDGSVFKDVDSIEFGDDFATAIATAVASCDVLLALIGARWATISDEHGHRRLDQPDDFVRREIEAALTRNVRVIPILIDRTRMPKADELPPSLAPLIHRQALDIDPSRFSSDTTRLIAVLQKSLDDKRLPPGATDSAAPIRRRRARIALAVGAAAAVLTAAVVFTTSKLGAPVTGTSTTPTTPRPAASGAVIAADDFSSTANGWTVSAASPADGGLENGAYRISVDPAPSGTGAGAFPRDAAAIYPVAPSDVVVEVTGTRLPSSQTRTDYGVMCRANVNLRSHVSSQRQSGVREFSRALGPVRGDCKELSRRRVPGAHPGSVPGRGGCGAPVAGRVPERGRRCGRAPVALSG
jgi:hypothetical protein